MPEQHRGNNDTRMISNELADLRSDWHWHQSKLEKLLDLPQPMGGQEMSMTQQQLRQIEVQIADAGRRLSARTNISAQADSLPQQIRHWSAEDYGAKLQQSLPGKQAYLHFFVINTTVQVLLVTSSTCVAFSLGTANSVDAALRAWRHHLRDWALITDQPTLANQIAQRSLTLLFRTLFQPLLPHLNHCSHMHFMLPPQWSDLPMAALLDAGTPLIERWTLTQLVSPLSLLRARSQRSIHAKSLLVGVAQEAGLTQTTRELHQISELAKGAWSHQLLLDEAATQQAVLERMPDCDLLHIATHAMFRADNPLFSWLQLADGRLTVADLYHRVKLTAHPLTVLSACETARGQHSGLLGVARALLAVGAGELIATQWKVEDNASAQLMGEFYRHWFAPGEPGSPHTATALATAQRTVARSLHPAYWAGFVNIG